MAAPKRPTHTVKHSGLYLRVAGKLQEMPVGTELTFSPDQAKKMEEKGMIQPIGKAVDLSETEANKEPAK